MSKTYILLLNTILFYLPIIKLTIFVFIETYKAFIRKEKELRKIYKKWAIVTGCTDGIGKALCHELATRGFNLILISRNGEKLKNLQTLITAENNRIDTKWLAVDFSDFSSEKQSDLKQLLEPIKNEIGILINNVGVAYEYPEYYHLLESKLKKHIVDVNVVSTQQMIDIVLPIMLANDSDGKISRKGAIINISSGSGFIPSPLCSLYSGTKAFIDLFSEGLHNEYKVKGVDIQSQQPFLVATKMSKIRPNRFIVCSPEEFAKASIKCIGYGPIEVPYWKHKIQKIIVESIPRAVVARVMLFFHQKIRGKALRKIKMTAVAEKS